VLITDAGLNPPAHRAHLLAMSSFFQMHEQIGIGVVQNDAASDNRNYYTGAEPDGEAAARHGPDPRAEAAPQSLREHRRRHGRGRSRHPHPDVQHDHQAAGRL
jgi:hypothetical protein